MEGLAEHAADVAYCVDEIRQGDRDRYLTTLLAPAGGRAALSVLYAFKLEVEKTHAVVSEPLLGQIRLQWWRDSLDGIYAGRPLRHAVVTPLAHIVDRRGLDRALFDRIIDGHERDLDIAPFADMAELESHCRAVEGSLVALAMAVLGEPPQGSRLELARTAGVAIGIAGLLRRMAANRRSGPLPVPAEVASMHGLDPDTLRLMAMDDPRLVAAVTDVAAATIRHLTAARARRTAAHPADRAALLPLVVARGILTRLRNAGYDVSDVRVAQPAPGEAWRLVLASLLRRA